MDKWIDLETFKTLLKDGQSIFIGGFLTCGTPEPLIDMVIASGVKDLTIIANDAGMPDKGVGRLIAHKRVKKLIATHIGTNPLAGKGMSDGSLEVELCPQGSFIERIRAFGSGLGGVLTPVGLHTLAEVGKDIVSVDGKDFLIEKALGADLALIEANQSDPLGNLTYSKTARNFNPVMATAGRIVCAYVYRRVQSIDPEAVITPHIFVDYLIGGKDHA